MALVPMQHHFLFARGCGRHEQPPSPLPAVHAACSSTSPFVGFEGSLTEMEHNVRASAPLMPIRCCAHLVVPAVAAAALLWPTQHHPPQPCIRLLHALHCRWAAACAFLTTALSR